MTAYPVHPKAAAFRMMHQYEFEALVEGIRDNGLLVPITLAKWVDTDTGEIIEGIIDGRNRDKACEAVGIKPQYLHFHGSGKDGIATEEEIAIYIEQSQNRRNLTLDQIVMARAVLFPESVHGLHKPDPALQVKEEDSSSLEQKGNKGGFAKRIQFARYIRKHRPDLVQSIVDGSGRDSIHKIVQDIRKAQKAEDEWITAIKELRTSAPDLARDVDEQTLDLKAAQEQLKQRLEETAGLKVFKRQHPELAELVDTEELTLSEAEEVLAKRIEEEAKQEKYEEDLADLRENDAELAKLVDDGELSLDNAIEQHNDAIEAAELLKRRLMGVFPDLADKVKNSEMTIEDAEKESKQRSIEAFRNAPPDLRPIIGKWEVAAMQSSQEGKQVSEELEKYEKYRDQIRIEVVDVIIMYAMMAHERWLKVVNILRGETDRKRHLNVVGGEDK